MKNALVIIASEGFQDVELKGVRDALLAAGFTVMLGSTGVGPCAGKFGSEELSEIALPDVEITDYDRIVFIGGPGARELWDDGDAIDIATDIVEAGKPLGAICIAPGILAKAGVLKGKKATIWNTDGKQAEVLTNAGAVFTDEPVTRDGMILTGNGPEAAEEFGKAFAAM